MSLLVPLLLVGLPSRHPACEPQPGGRSPASRDFQGALTETFDPEGTGLIDRFFAELPVCELKEFLFDGTVGRAFTPTGVIEHEDLLVLHDELAGDRAGLPHRRYYGGPAERTSLRKEILVLAGRMAELGNPRLKLSMLTSKASAQLELRTAQERIGECYEVEYGGADQPLRLLVPVSVEQQASIDGLFTNAGTAHSTNDPTLAPEELGELRALRMATGRLESFVGLGDDVGGWVGNVLANAQLGRQQSCTNEGATALGFVETLSRRKMLRYFEPAGVLERGSGISLHVAVKIHCVRTHGAYVLDTWRENGGEPGHVLKLKDWLERNDEADVVGLE
jgi:hypothetical protein